MVTLKAGVREHNTIKPKLGTGIQKYKIQILNQAEPKELMPPQIRTWTHRTASQKGP